jgi:hypothetical protein
MFAARIYRKLLNLYPPGFRARFGAEMQSVFEESAAEHRRRSPRSVFPFALKEFLGLIAGGATERHAAAARLRPPPPFPTDIPGAEQYIALASQRVIAAIAHHDFPNARYYDLQERKARALLAHLRTQLN